MRKLALGMLLAAAMVSPALAQRGPGRGDASRGGFGGDRGGLMLLAQPAVQKELKLTDEQKQKVADAATKQRAAFEGLRDLSREQRQKRFEESRQANQQAADAILDAEQTKRLGQIRLQLQGAQAFATPEVANALGLSDDQKKQIDTIQQATREQMRDAFQPGGDRDAARAKFREARQATQEQLKAVLTTEQQAKWQELLGAPFEAELERPGAPAEGPRRRRPRDSASLPVQVPTTLTADTTDEPAAKAESAAADEEKQAGAKREKKDRAKASAAKRHHGKHRHHQASAHRHHGPRGGAWQHAYRSHRGGADLSRHASRFGRPAPHLPAARAAAWHRVARAMGYSGEYTKLHRGERSHHGRYFVSHHSHPTRGPHPAWHGRHARPGFHKYAARGPHRSHFAQHGPHYRSHHRHVAAGYHHGFAHGPRFAHWHRGHGPDRYAHFAPRGAERARRHDLHHGPHWGYAGRGPRAEQFAGPRQHERPSLHRHHERGPGHDRLHLTGYKKKHRAEESKAVDGKQCECSQKAKHDRQPGKPKHPRHHGKARSSEKKTEAGKAESDKPAESPQSQE